MIKEILIVTFLFQFIYGLDVLDFGEFKKSCGDGELLADKKICLTKNYRGLMQNPPSSKSLGSLIGNALLYKIHEIRHRLNFIEMEDVQILHIGMVFIRVYCLQYLGPTSWGIMFDQIEILL